MSESRLQSPGALALQPHPAIMDSLVYVTDDVDQVRAADLSSMTFLQGATGAVVIHPFTSEAMLSAALGIYRRERGPAPVSATVHTDGTISWADGRPGGPGVGLVDLDGVTAEFFAAPDGAEPAGSLIWFPASRLIIAAEEVTHHLHELDALRGQHTLNAGPWWRVIDDLLHHCGAEVNVILTQHHWPVWGNAQVLSLLTAQRDMLRYLDEERWHGAEPARLDAESAPAPASPAAG